MKRKVIKNYYFDEVNDDFAKNNINGKKTPNKFKYYHRSIFYKIYKFVIYDVIIFPIVFVWMSILLRGGIKNKKCLKKLPKNSKGYFIYGNHTSGVADSFSGPLVAFPKQAYIIANPDCISIKGISWLVKALGALPVPNNKRTYLNFLKGVDALYNHGSVITIYPEAHIWPKYNDIREFPSISFHYPVKLNAPCFAKTTVYKLKKNGHTRPLIYLDGPFYPNKELSFKEAEIELRNEIFKAMKKRVMEEKSCLDKSYQYIKVNSAEEVHSEKVYL